jgi:hypothetical protein
LSLCADQKAVEHAHVRLWLGAGKDKDSLIGVGDDDLFSLAQVALAIPAPSAAPFGARGQSGQRPLPFGNLPYGSRAILGNGSRHPIAHGDQVGVAPLFCQPSTHPRHDLSAVVSLHGEKTTLRFDDHAFELVSQVLLLVVTTLRRLALRTTVAQDDMIVNQG